MSDIMAMLKREGRLTQGEVALAYADQMQDSDTNWQTINNAIMSRWSRSGLNRVKRMAWKIADARSIPTMKVTP